MNFRLAIFAGIMTGLIGAMIGLALAKIAERRPIPRAENESIERKFAVVGGALGFGLGVVLDGIRQQKAEIEGEVEELDEQDQQV